MSDTTNRDLSFLLDDPISDIDENSENSENRKAENQGLQRMATKLFKMSQAIPCEAIPQSAFRKGCWFEDRNHNGDALPKSRRFSKHSKSDVKLRGSFTCSISGEWGSGKTSLLNLLYEQFENEEFDDNRKCVTVWFEPWKYENEEHLLIPLLIEFNAKVVESLKDPKLKQAALNTGKKMIGRFVKGLLKTASGIVEKQTGINAFEIGESFVKEYSDLEQETTSLQSELERFKNEFRELIALAASSTAKSARSKQQSSFPPVVIFIDDLDRCESKQIRRLIESIKLFLHERGVYFFLALDKTQVLNAIASGFGKEQTQDYNMYRAKLYLEKFFQLNIELNERSLPYQHDISEFAINVKDKLDLEALWSDLLLDESIDKNKHDNLWEVFENSVDKGFSNIKANPRAIKKVARWLYYQIGCKSGHYFTEYEIYMLSFNFLEYVIENNWPDIWLESLSKVSLMARAVLYQQVGLKLLEAQKDDRDFGQFDFYSYCAYKVMLLLRNDDLLGEQIKAATDKPSTSIYSAFFYKLAFFGQAKDFESLSKLFDILEALSDLSNKIVKSIELH